MARIRLEKLLKLYPKNPRPSVNGIDLDIADREFIVLVGPSGCGKSTTLRMVAGLEEITGGTIRIDDRVVNDIPPKDRDIAMVFQNYALYPHMTVYENMAFGLKMQRRKLGLSKDQIKARVLEAAAMLGIGDFLQRRPRELSGGQRQRVAVGRAIVRNPKAFLFDEPLSNLDAKLRVETRAQIKRLHLQLRTTTLYVTHDQEEAMTLGDRIVVMKDGIIQQCAPPLEVYDRPANRFVAGFVGTPPMNFIEGRVEAGEFRWDNQAITLPPHIMNAARDWNGRPVILGVRPEGLSLSRDGKFNWPGNDFAAKVNVLEPLGDKVDIGLTVEGNAIGGTVAPMATAEQTTPGHLVCRADAHEFGKTPIGGIIKVFMDLGRVHLFEPGDNGVNITLTRETSHAAA